MNCKRRCGKQPTQKYYDSQSESSEPEINEGLTHGGCYRRGNRAFEGKKSSKGAAGGIGAPQNQPTAMGLGDPAGNRKTQARAAGVVFGARARFIYAKETFEDAVLRVLRYAWASVGDTQRVFLAGAMDRNADGASTGCVSDGVVQQIEDHAP